MASVHVLIKFWKSSIIWLSSNDNFNKIGKVKTQSKKPPKGVNYFKILYIFLKNHKENIIIWIVNIIFEIGPIICKVSMFKIWCN